MPVIRIETWIQAPVPVCFDCARNVDLHVESMRHTREKAVAGVTSGLLEMGQEVKWEGTHFGIRLRLTSRITRFERPHHFRDSQARGPFRRFDHDHLFREVGAATIMTDVFDYTAPFGWLGRLIDGLFLERYMRRLLWARTTAILDAAERSAAAVSGTATPAPQTQ